MSFMTWWSTYNPLIKLNLQTTRWWLMKLCLGDLKAFSKDHLTGQKEKPVYTEQDIGQLVSKALDTC